MSYEYDVFLSYTTAFPFGEWVHEHLLPFFAPFLNDALNREAKIFNDRNGILSGDQWPERLKSALAHSRCMVGVWSPSYFNSTWCMNEFAVMWHREKELGYRTVQKPNGLIIPLKIFDGEYFPKFVSGIQQKDCKKYARVGEGFKKTTRYIDFQDMLTEWVNEVAAGINSAPNWSEAWMNKEWIDDPINNIPEFESCNFKKPALE